ncbi:chorismate-binding protein [Haloactinopolyspora alba]|nr:chorismate-binding protein [Haloactinopolyspora alba]
MPHDLRELLDDPDPPAFAVLRRADGPGIELLIGDVVDVDQLADVPLPAPTAGDATPHVLALVPYRQVTERGFECHDDATPLRCLVVREHTVLTTDDVLAAVPDGPVDVADGAFDVDDDAYADIVGRVIRDEIGRGEGANFVVRRDYRARLTGGTVPAAALRLFRRLLTGEPNAYWTFAVHAGDATMVGATPERHVSLTGRTVTMNPISGTYRAPADGPAGDGLLSFLADPKETEELFMVVDEELKMMSRVCERGGRVIGPYLKEMGHLAHTEYLLEGTTDADVRGVLRETMFAPTVTGSPIENAARVVRRYEGGGRGYYSGVAALIGQDGAGRRTLDAPILIRTAYLEPSGDVRVPVGATLVRHSVAAHEVAETHAKAAGVLAALGVRASRRRAVDAPSLAGYPDVAEALTARNAALAPFWLRPQHGAVRADLAGRSVLIVDAEDRWTAMLAHLFRHLGADATVVRWDDTVDIGTPDLLVSGPGPGDPRAIDDPRMTRLRELLSDRLAERRPLLAVCLSHQVLAGLLGFDVGALPRPYQGTQREVDVFGARHRLGFYNTFTPSVPDGVIDGVEVATAGDEVHALRGPGFVSVQFHLESVLSVDGIDLLAELTSRLLTDDHRHLAAHETGLCR